MPLVEAMKLALADRDIYYADPLFVACPCQELLSPPYADLRRPLIDMTPPRRQQSPETPRGQPPGQAGPRPTGCAAGRSTIPRPVSSPTGRGTSLRPRPAVVRRPAGSTGVSLGTRLRSFNLWDGHPNCIEPGKRPRITLAPTLVLRGGRAVAAISVAGGDHQDQVTLQLLLDYVEFGLSPADAVTAPRFITNHLIGSFNQPPPQLGNLVVEESLAGNNRRAASPRNRIQVQ